jgi:hypothetical protein
MVVARGFGTGYAFLLIPAEHHNANLAFCMPTQITSRTMPEGPAKQATLRRPGFGWLTHHGSYPTPSVHSRGVNHGIDSIGRRWQAFTYIVWALNIAPNKAPFPLRLFGSRTWHIDGQLRDGGDLWVVQAWLVSSICLNVHIPAMSALSQHGHAIAMICSHIDLFRNKWDRLVSSETLTCKKRRYLGDFICKVVHACVHALRRQP